MSLTVDGIVLNATLNLASTQDVAEIKALLTAILLQGDRMSAELDTLTTEVAETKAVMASAATLIGGLAAQIRALANDPAALLALASDLDSGKDDLAAAVAANTPSAEEPPAGDPV